MPIPLLSKIFGGGAAEILKGAGDILDQVITNKEEVIKAKTELEKVVSEQAARMEMLANQADKNYLDDIANARNMNTESVKSSDPFVRRFSYYLAGAQILLTFGIFAALLFLNLDSKQKDIILILLGALISDKNLINSFFYGSSKSSQVKDETIQKMANDNPKQ